MYLQQDVFEWNFILWILREHLINSYSLKQAGVTIGKLMSRASLLQRMSISAFGSLVIHVGLPISCLKLKEECIALGPLWSREFINI